MVFLLQPTMWFFVKLIVFILITFESVFSLQPEENYQLLKSQMCPECIREPTSNAANECQVQICNCETGNTSSSFPFTRHTENSVHFNASQIRIPAPSVYCVDYNQIALTWPPTPNTFYSVEYIGSPTDKGFTALTRCGYTVISNLQYDRYYRLILHIFTIIEGQNLVINMSSPLRVRTPSPHRRINPVQNFTLLNYSFKQNRLEVTVHWGRVRDACFYEIVVFGNDDYWIKEINDPLSNRRTVLDGFSFGEDYAIQIVAFAELGYSRIESGKSWLNITTPSCFESQFINTCVPEKPQNLTIEELPQDYNYEIKHHVYNIFAYWAAPRVPPDCYFAKIQSLDNDFNITVNITGDSTNYTFTNIILGHEYQIFLAAYSANGMSTPAVIHRHINSSYLYVDNNESQLTLEVIILLIVCPIIIIGIILMFIGNHYLVKGGKRKHLAFLTEFNMKMPVSLTTSIATISEQVDKPDKWELNSKDIIMKDFLGEGEFGIVRKGNLNGNDQKSIDIAIKMLRDNATEEEKRQLLQEIEIMKSVPSHPNLVGLVGCITKGIQPLLITEYCSKGNLQSYLRNAWNKLSNTYLNKDIYEVAATNKVYEFSDGELDDIPQPKVLISFARQIAVGMEYLSSMKLIHRDLAARNILVYDKYTVKISDFGLSRDVYYDNIYCKLTGGKLPLRWMALESMTHQVYTTQSDVWSFGILLWEIVTMGGSPYPGVSTQNLLNLLKQGYRMEKPPNCNEELYAIMLSCWQASPKDRPSFGELKKSFDILLEEISYYLHLDFKEPNLYIEHSKIEANHYDTC